MKIKIFFLILLVLTCSKILAISANINKEYLYTLLTEDYGILSDNDLAAYTWGKLPRPFDGKMSAAYHYCQCFPRTNISMTLEDFGHSSEDIGWKDTYSDISILVYSKPDVFHKYTMHHIFQFSLNQRIFNLWHKLMKGEKYVCLAGSFDKIEQKIQNGEAQEIYSWTFDKIKTKKDCDSYFDGGCHRTYQQFLEEQKKYEQWKRSQGY